MLKLSKEELDRLLETYTRTSGMDRLRNGYVGDRAHPAAGELYQSVLNATRGVLQLCTEHGGLVPGYRQQGIWTIPEVPTLAACGSKKLRLVVVTPSAGGACTATWCPSSRPWSAWCGWWGRRCTTGGSGG